MGFRSKLQWNKNTAFRMCALADANVINVYFRYKNIFG